MMIPPAPRQAPRPPKSTLFLAALRREQLAWKVLPITLVALLCALAALQVKISWTEGQHRSLVSVVSSTLDSAAIAPPITSATPEPPVESEQTLLDVNTLPETPPPAPTPPRLSQSIQLEPIALPELTLALPPASPADELAMIEDEFTPEAVDTPEKRKPERPQARSKTRSTPTPRQQQSRRLAQQPKPQAKSAQRSGSAGVVSKTQPRYRSAPKPPYPRSLRARQVEGTVRVRIAVSAHGKPTQVNILGTSGYREFDSTARSWIMSRWSFVPATQNGRAIASSVTTRIHFTLHT